MPASGSANGWTLWAEYVARVETALHGEMGYETNTNTLDKLIHVRIRKFKNKLGKKIFQVGPRNHRVVTVCLVFLLGGNLWEDKCFLWGEPHGSIPGSCCQLSDGISTTSKHGPSHSALGGMETHEDCRGSRCHFWGATWKGFPVDVSWECCKLGSWIKKMGDFGSRFFLGSKSHQNHSVTAKTRVIKQKWCP